MVERIKTKLEHQDEFGVINYNNSFLFLAAFALLYTLIALLAVPLVWFETTQGGDSANITTYADAFWTLQMSASTIGFGDFYPVTLGGAVARCTGVLSGRGTRWVYWGYPRVWIFRFC